MEAAHVQVLALRAVTSRNPAELLRPPSWTQPEYGVEANGSNTTYRMITDFMKWGGKISSK
jgi:hypothetical protein